MRRSASDDPAFPVPFSTEGKPGLGYDGMTVREYMATHILACMVADGKTPSDHSWDASYASHAVELADALLRALATKPQK